MNRASALKLVELKWSAAAGAQMIPHLWRSFGGHTPKLLFWWQERGTWLWLRGFTILTRVWLIDITKRMSAVPFQWWKHLMRELKWKAFEAVETYSSARCDLNPAKSYADIIRYQPHVKARWCMLMSGWNCSQLITYSSVLITCQHSAIHNHSNKLNASTHTHLHAQWNDRGLN